MAAGRRTIDLTLALSCLLSLLACQTAATSHATRPAPGSPLAVNRVHCALPGHVTFAPDSILGHALHLFCGDG
jgi:hypothetical protein